ncbi:MAG TPA: signal recognition particle-docking protein FtsY [Nanoarchaeota archaeon]|nr:signal recognition particle-docking protein FtsY [Nanoarchaeota archaeon]
MFGFLKKAIDGFAKKAEAEVSKEETKENKVVEKLEAVRKELKQAEKIIEHTDISEKAEQKSGFLGKLFSKPDVSAEIRSAPLKEVKKIEEKVGFLEQVTKAITETKISDVHFERIFSALEEELCANNVSLEVIRRIKEKLRKDLVDISFKRGHVADIIKDDLRDEIYSILTSPAKININNLISESKQKGKTFTIMFVGANGHGKTTTIAKFAHLLKQNGTSCVFAASDTFRAASIEQLEVHGNKLGIRVIKQQYGADPAAVAFDAIRHASANRVDCVLIDTAGRQHTNANLMDELKKIKRVAKPDLTIFIGESIAGNDVVEQISDYNKAIGIDAIILTKADVDDKGGAVISAVHSVNKPILFLGVGQEYKDLMEFNAGDFVKKILG